MKAVGATTKICDGKFNPTSVADCLKQAGDQGADAVVSLFVDYAMAGTAFDALAAKGVPTSSSAASPPPAAARPTRPWRSTTTPAAVNKLYEAMATSAVANGGADTKALFLRLMDSSTTARRQRGRPWRSSRSCARRCKVATAEFTTANLDKLPSAVSAAPGLAPGHQHARSCPVDSFVPPALQGVQSAGKAGKIKVVSSSSDLAGLQRIKDGQQVSDLGTPVHLRGLEVRQRADAAAGGRPGPEG